MAETRLAAHGGVFVNHTLAAGLIETLGSDFESGFGLIDLSGLDRRQNSFGVCSQFGLDRTILGPADDVLTKPFGGTLDVWHA